MNYYKYLPFLDDKDIDELIQKITNKEVTNVPLHNLFPFVSQSSLDELVDYMIKEKDNDNITKSLPFVSDETLNKIRTAIKDGSLPDFNDARLLPFMSSASVKDMFYEKVKQAKEQETDSTEDTK